MIGSLRGKVILKDGLNLILEIGGVGYRVLVSERTLAKAILGKEFFLFTYAHIREDSFDLLGFEQVEDLKLFENLIGVSGIGPKTAMSIFSFSTREEIVGAVLKGDVEFFTVVPRLGRKNAQKLIIELKNKLGDKGSIDLTGLKSKENEEIVAALKTFGFSNQEAYEALKNLDDSIEKPEEKIKQALKYLGR